MISSPNSFPNANIDQLVGLTAYFLPLAFTSSRASSASISEKAGASSVFLNEASGLKRNASCYSSILPKTCSSNIFVRETPGALLETQLTAM